MTETAAEATLEAGHDLQAVVGARYPIAIVAKSGGTAADLCRRRKNRCLEWPEALRLDGASAPCLPGRTAAVHPLHRCGTRSSCGAPRLAAIAAYLSPLLPRNKADAIVNDNALPQLSSVPAFPFAVTRKTWTFGAPAILAHALRGPIDGVQHGNGPGNVGKL